MAKLSPAGKPPSTTLIPGKSKTAFVTRGQTAHVFYIGDTNAFKNFDCEQLLKLRQRTRSTFDRIPITSTVSAVFEQCRARHRLKGFLLRLGFRELSADDDEYWTAAKLSLPSCPIFRRLELSPDDQQAQEATAKNAEAFFEAMFSGATDATIVESGRITKFSVTHKLTDENDDCH
jgi:hypothetical protein